MSAPTAAAERPSPPEPELPGVRRLRLGYRWIVCGLLFLATTINYLDRFMLGVLAPELQGSIGWSDSQYGDINAAFSLAYAIGMLLLGRFIDRVGVKIGYAVALVAWSLAAAGHALARTAGGFATARFLLGLGEAGNFPAAIKATAEWFPRRERALAAGIFNAGSNVGAMIAPLLAPWIALNWGWEAAFAATGLVGILWVVLWLPLYNAPERVARVSREELDWIRSDPPTAEGRVRWADLFPLRETWAIAVGRFFTDPIWWFYLVWSGKFLADRFGVDLKRIGPPLVTIYVMADFGSIAGGWLSSRLIDQGWSTNAARKTTLLICAACVVPVTFAPLVEDMWTAVFLIGLAAAAHQGFSANLYTITSDMFPRSAVGSVIGIGGMAGATGNILMQTASGRIKEATGGYLAMFAAAGSVYLLSVLAIHLLVPHLSSAQLGVKEGADDPA